MSVRIERIREKIREIISSKKTQEDVEDALFDLFLSIKYPEIKVYADQGDNTVPYELFSFFPTEEKTLIPGLFADGVTLTFSPQDSVESNFHGED